MSVRHSLAVLKHPTRALSNLVLALTLSLSFSSFAHAEGVISSEYMVVDGILRNYSLYVPAGMDSTPRPLVFLLHGGSGDDEFLLGDGRQPSPYEIWLDIADREGLILALPNGEENSMGTAVWNDCRGDSASNSVVDDVAFVSALIDRLADTLPVDTQRVYSTGTSNGGHMSIRLALELSDRIAAVAPVSAGMPGFNICGEAVNPISILFMNGTRDPFMPYEGGQVAALFDPLIDRGTAQSVEDSVAYWVNHNATDSAATKGSYPNIFRRDRSKVESYSYSNGQEETEVVLIKVNGGGHLEPSLEKEYGRSYELLLGKQNHDIEMAEVVWNFFKGKTL